MTAQASARTLVIHVQKEGSEVHKVRKRIHVLTSRPAVFALGLVTAFGLMGSAAFAADGSTVLRDCVNNSNGQLRMLLPGQTC